ncbi:RNA polymerase sigma factor SigZ [Shewanella sp. MBTL60-007]|uniref:RNA polymerase sigma factor SigZ n=1 Tax=Shewanella sp. MBTL60-007 TaxID=2815911 RepID=UPI001BC58690|nr:RNA polymerase sigma factor SigZ [Shewanella sp. MBTL60-007]GIU15387.1 RNA polymerase sigma factor SigZ [Shewanella sp. MBTL60-007]
MSMRLESIWTEYQSSLKAFLHRKVANTADVEDLLQEILIKTHKSLQTVTDSSKIKPWIFQIANNTIIDFYRKNSQLSKLTADDLWYDEQDEALIIKELSHCLLPFIKQLPEEDAKLLIAIEIDGTSQKDFAEQNQLNYSTLKSRVKQSRKKLYQLFNSCCEFSIDSKGNIMEYQSKSGHCDRC